MTTNFFAPPSAIRGRRVVLPENESRHVCSVLRAREGDEITVVDGEGGWYRVEIAHASPEQVVGTILDTHRDRGEPDVHATVGVGLLTKRSRFETFVEKAVELGVRRVVPLQTAHTETDSIRPDRLRNVMIAAVKQCRRSRLPILAEPTSVATIVDETTAGSRFICHGGADASPILRVLDETERTKEVLVLVGPEGGFTPEEVTTARDAGCRPVSLGRRRLRAETAGIVALNAVLLQSQSESRE